MLIPRQIGDPIPNAAYPTAGQGLVLDANGKLPYGVSPIVRIYDNLLTASAASFAIPVPVSPVYNYIEIEARLRTDEVSTQSNFGIQINGDTAAHYDYDGTQFVAATITGFELYAQTSIAPFTCPGASATANVVGQCDMKIDDYANASTNKTLNGESASKVGTTAGSIRNVSASGFWRSNAQVTLVTIVPLPGPNFVAGSRVTAWVKI